PVAGFVSKWYLGMGAAAAGEYLFIAILITSSLLNAAYFLPMVHAAWFQEPSEEWRLAFESRTKPRGETSLLLLGPTLATAGMALLAGLFAASPYSPLGLAQMIVRGFYP